VHNFGVSIAEDNLASVFKPLVQLSIENDTDTRPKPSLGLGLFVAKEIAVAHGGTITVASDEETGTVFTVRLPRGGSRTTWFGMIRRSRSFELCIGFFHVMSDIEHTVKLDKSNLTFRSRRNYENQGIRCHHHAHG